MGGGGGGGEGTRVILGREIRRKWVPFELQMNGGISIQNGCHIGLVIKYGYILPLLPIQYEPYFQL